VNGLILGIGDAELLVHFPVIKHSEDVLSRTINGSAKQEVGEAEVVVFLRQQIIAILCNKFLQNGYQR
jgi:hypothetical protein